MSSDRRSVTVSVGLPVRNGEDYLDEAIDGVLNQTLRELELVIVDNASTDSTPRICERYARQDDRVRYLRNDQNIGIAANFNKAFQCARGPYFTWVAHDDVYAPDFLARCVSALEHNLAAVVAHTDIQGIDAEGSALPYDADQRAFVVDAERNDLRYFDIARWADTLSKVGPVRRMKAILNNVGYASGYTIYGVIRSAALRTTGLFQAFGSENLLMAELALRGPFCYVPAPLFHFRLHSQNSGLGTRRDLMHAHLGHPPALLFPLKTFLNYVHAVEASPLGPLQKLRCLGMVARHALRLESLKRLVVPGPLNYFGINHSESGGGYRTGREAHVQEPPVQTVETSR